MKHNKLFILLSVTILFLDISFILINYYYNKTTLHDNMQETNRTLYTAYNTELESTYENLLLIATLYAEDPWIQALFLKGKNALEKEGGGEGGKESALIRQAILDHTLAGWNKAKKNFNVRLFQFHLGPGDTSFLRVHRPEKFGDNMDDVRFTIVDTNKEHTPRTGFEIGRVYSGLRGVVPVFSSQDEDSEKQFIGTLEIGTAFTSMFKHIDANFDTGLAILLKKDHLKKHMWPDFFKKNYTKDMQICNSFLEEASRQGADEIIHHIEFSNEEIVPDGQLNFLEIDNKYYFATFYSFNDYLGYKTGIHDYVGSILIWKDITKIYTNYLKEQKINITYGLMTFIIIELLLFITFRLSHHYFKETISTQGKKLDEKEELLQTITLKNKQLIESRKVADKANQAKSEFLASMSHELRTPLNSIIGYAQLFKYDKKLAQKHLDNSEQINEAGQHLLILINGLLDLAKIEAHQMTLDISDVYLVDLIKECRVLVDPMAEKKQIVIDYQLTQCVHIVKADSIRLKQVLVNLVSNAIKYTGKQGKISVFCTPDPQGNIKLSVSDSGQGISIENQKKLFQAFNRLGEENGTIQGTGIGLVISQKLMEMMAGKIDFCSTLGEGSTFWLVLKNSSHNVPVDTGNNVPFKNEQQNSESDELFFSQDHFRCVLYIEDNKSNLLLMESIFSTRNDLKLLDASSGEAGVALAIKHRPDIILMDINLPGIDGYEAARRLAENPDTCNIPIIALTANAMHKDIKQSGESGFKAHISKPIDIKEFFKVMDNVL